ncbi:hypothetical protein [Bacillus phage SPbetaL1]|nr:hypothetical protein [Bacillus phage SPbetaL1]
MIINNQEGDLQAKYDDMLYRNGLCFGFLQLRGLEDEFIEHMRRVAEYEKDLRYKKAASNFLKMIDHIKIGG